MAQMQTEVDAGGLSLGDPPWNGFNLGKSSPNRHSRPKNSGPSNGMVNSDSVRTHFEILVVLECYPDFFEIYVGF